MAGAGSLLLFASGLALVTAALIFSVGIWFVSASRKRWIRGLVCGSLVGGCAAGAVLLWLMAGACTNSENGRVPSPDGTHEVVSFTRNCGATVGYVEAASVLPRGAKLGSAGGNLFNYPQLERTFAIVWENEKTVRLCWPDLEALRSEMVASLPNEVSGIAIRYAGQCG